ncbi:MAG: phosphate ABC transporter substrate-binding protein [Verrucomicrobiia bacterium]
MKMNKIKTIVGAVLGVAVVVASAQAATTIIQKGSDTMVILAQKWAEVYMSKHPEVKIQVTGGGSGTGIAALQNQTTHLCDASRKIKAKEIEACIAAFGKRPTEYKVAIDGLSVYVNSDNPIKELSTDQLELIFTGKIKNWKEVGGPDAPIVLYSRENSSGTYEFFKEHILKGKDFAANAQTMPGTAALIQAISKDKNGVGYGGAAYGEGVKSLLIKKDANSPGIAPTEENVVNGTYPIWRYLYIYVNPALDKGEIAQYLRWILSDEGQAVVKEIGYYPLPKNLRNN